MLRSALVDQQVSVLGSKFQREEFLAVLGSKFQRMSHEWRERVWDKIIIKNEKNDYLNKIDSRINKLM